MNAQNFGYSADCKLALTNKEAMSLFAAGWEQVSDFDTQPGIVAVPIKEWQPETIAQHASSDNACWVVFAPPA